MTVGHLPRDDAAVLHRYLAAVQKRGKHAQCEGRVVVANNGEYSIYLHLASLDAVVRVATTGQQDPDGRA